MTDKKSTLLNRARLAAREFNKVHMTDLKVPDKYTMKELEEIIKFMKPDSKEDTEEWVKSMNPDSGSRRSRKPRKSVKKPRKSRARRKSVKPSKRKNLVNN